MQQEVSLSPRDPPRVGPIPIAILRLLGTLGLAGLEPADDRL
jgi:hypothetical protein